MNNMTTGQRIASRRKLANLSQEDIGQELGVSRQAVSKWESDAGLPDIDNLITLSKRFGVSVGWLLGTEKDPAFDPSTGLSDAQLKMVEGIIERNKPHRNRGWIAAILAACILMLSVFGIFFRGKLQQLSEENAAAKDQITALEQSNQALLARVDNMSAALAQQTAEDALLLNCHTKAFLSNDGQSISLSFYLIPKLFQENAQAYVAVRNQENELFETVKCKPMGSWYFCQTELPVCNGYQYSFLLATESGFQEQLLEDVAFVRYFHNLHDATRYYRDPSAEARSVWNMSETEYSFTQPICSPLIDFQSAFVGYEEVNVTLYHNGQPVHTESLREAFRDHGGPYMRFEEPFVPDIRVKLPQLTVGDTLTLEITAKSYNSNVMLTNVLETLEVVQ